MAVGGVVALAEFGGDLFFRRPTQQATEHAAFGFGQRGAGDEQTVAQHQLAVEPLDAAQDIGQGVALLNGEGGLAVGAEETEIGFGVGVEGEGDVDCVVAVTFAVVGAVSVGGEPFLGHHVA